MNEIVLLASAEADLLSGFQYYDNIQEGRGDEFIRRSEQALTMLRRHPFIGSPYHQNFRKILIQKFPYAIFYVPEGARVIVHAVLDLRMDPARIRRKLVRNR